MSSMNLSKAGSVKEELNLKLLEMLFIIKNISC